jgi:hypothetical protein
MSVHTYDYDNKKTEEIISRVNGKVKACENG